MRLLECIWDNWSNFRFEKWAQREFNDFSWCYWWFGHAHKGSHYHFIKGGGLKGCFANHSRAPFMRKRWNPLS